MQTIKKGKKSCILKIKKIDIKILLNYWFYVLCFWNELKTLRGENFKMYIIEEMLSMNFNFLILTKYEFITLSSRIYIKP
jgi:hypothetical protein